MDHDDSPRLLRFLSLDGGGIRGLSSLLILEHVMEGIREAGLEQVPRQCDRFDLIGGTSTGGHDHRHHDRQARHDRRRVHSDISKGGRDGLYPEANGLPASVVLAITKDNIDAPPTLFTTYDTSTSLSGCTIWQVAQDL
ncbi:hypothetical protein B0J13DRAFT_621934 [Dactylonectria estremocensis]|uniref:PNPLA domain-containing protein n=1 Tax=Dactylonectria estremocensis TaxID=1079267 RepID=A0A9P9EYP1_9HYPO|nr:hypothetical protein B0J13DRAFT_621934 [Dactylonectria estremocensis]